MLDNAWILAMKHSPLLDRDPDGGDLCEAPDVLLRSTFFTCLHLCQSAALQCFAFYPSCAPDGGRMYSQSSGPDVRFRTAVHLVPGASSSPLLPPHLFFNIRLFWRVKHRLSNI